jgi:formylglycine-generating enzyme required for sulfatase activity
VSPGGKIKIGNESFAVEPYYISRYMITYPQYEAFVKAADGYDNAEWWAGMPKEYQKQKLWAATNKLGNYPRDTVSWYQAVAYTRWLNKRLAGIELAALGNTKGMLGVTRQGKPLVIGKNAEIRLPTEWEWQWAAQGGEEGREYPWGAWQEGYANTDEAELGRATAVGMYPQGAAVCGAMDMSGNLWEWCLNKYKEPKEVAVDGSGDSRVLRGGSFGDDVALASCASRLNNYPNYGLNPFGFRLVVCSANAPSEL